MKEERKLSLKPGQCYASIWPKIEGNSENLFFIKVKENDGRILVCDFVEQIVSLSHTECRYCYEENKKLMLNDSCSHIRYSQVKNSSEIGYICPDDFCKISEDKFEEVKTMANVDICITPNKAEEQSMCSSLNDVLNGYIMAADNFMRAKISDIELCDAACESYDKTLRDGPNEDIFTSCRYILGYKDGYKAAFEMLKKKLFRAMPKNKEA